MLNQHEQIKSEIDGYADEYASMKSYGEQVVEGQDDVQYMFLREVCVEFLLGEHWNILAYLYLMYVSSLQLMWMFVVMIKVGLKHSYSAILRASPCILVK